MEEYNSSGVLIKTYTTNSPISSAGGGFGIVGNTVYYDNTSGYVSGPIVGNTINFTVIDPNGLTPSPSDFASCIFGSGSASSSHDTIFTCANAAPIQLQAADNAPYNWSIINGSGTINGTGQNVSIAPTSNVAVVVHDSTLCGTGSDTFSIFVPTATINLSYPSSTTLPCNTKTTSLTVTVSNNINNTNFFSSWTPTNAIINGINTLQPIINLDSAVNYTLTLIAPVNQGGCIITKSFHFDFSACDTVTIKFPNAFSPGIEGVNANFHPLGNVKHVTYLDFRIYNRWGQEVYVSNDALKGWDGNFLDKPSPQDVYVYSAVYKVVGDVDYRHITGNVTLLR